MKNHIRLPDSELELMLIIWNIGEKVSTSEIMEVMKDKKTVQVVQTYLGRLEEKDFVTKEKLGRLNYYVPLISKDDYIANETNRFVDTFYNNSTSKLVAALIKDKTISTKELESLKKLIEKGGD